MGEESFQVRKSARRQPSVKPIITQNGTGGKGSALASGCRKSIFASLGKFENIKNVFKFVRIEKKGNPDGSLSNYPSLRNLKESGFIDKLRQGLCPCLSSPIPPGGKINGRTRPPAQGRLPPTGGKLAATGRLMRGRRCKTGYSPHPPRCARHLPPTGGKAERRASFPALSGGDGRSPEGAGIAGPCARVPMRLRRGRPPDAPTAFHTPASFCILHSAFCISTPPARRRNRPPGSGPLSRGPRPFSAAGTGRACRRRRTAAGPCTCHPRTAGTPGAGRTWGW